MRPKPGSAPRRVPCFCNSTPNSRIRRTSSSTGLIWKRSSAAAQARKVRLLRSKSLFSNSLVAGLSMVVVKNGLYPPKRYYARRIPAERDGVLQMRYLVDRGDRERTEFIPAKDIISKDLSPQSKLASRAKELLSDRTKVDQWETLTIGLLRAIASDTEVDPIVQVILLKSVVKASGEGSEPIRILLEGMKKQLDQAKIDLELDWTDPDDGPLADDKTNALKLVESLRAKCPPKASCGRLAIGLNKSFVERTGRSAGWSVSAIVAR